MTPSFDKKRGKLDEKDLNYAEMIINDTVSSDAMQARLRSCSRLICIRINLSVPYLQFEYLATTWCPGSTLGDICIPA